MDPQLITAFTNIGSVGIVLWWLTQKLIPEMQAQLNHAIASFEKQMETERALHREMTEKYIAHSQWMMEMVQKMLEKQLS